MRGNLPDLLGISAEQGVEVALDMKPGQILGATVGSVIQVTGEGQGIVNGMLPEISSIRSEGYFAVRIHLDENA